MQLFPKRFQQGFNLISKLAAPFFPIHAAHASLCSQSLQHSIIQLRVRVGRILSLTHFSVYQAELFLCSVFGYSQSHYRPLHAHPSSGLQNSRKPQKTIFHSPCSLPGSVLLLCVPSSIGRCFSKSESNKINRWQLGRW